MAVGGMLPCKLASTVCPGSFHFSVPAVWRLAAWWLAGPHGRVQRKWKEKKETGHSIINALSGPDSADKWEKPSTSNFPPTFIGFRRDWGIGMPHAAANGEHDIVLIFSARSVR